MYNLLIIIHIKSLLKSRNLDRSLKLLQYTLEIYSYKGEIFTKNLFQFES